ncbi:hypothetical protein BA188_11655 [Aeromonas hydrophila]|nr:pmgO [Aeromonas hydrophila]OFC42750.1 hypothetical protein BA189_04345 [Aeromonas hydrophila]OFC52646.1 hypothetical protein BA188_11655 [Aeromonas hydrophila]
MSKTDHAFICIASGPSLTREDCALVSRSGLPIIAANSSCMAVPECQYIFASDYSWWLHHRGAVPAGPELWTQSRRAAAAFGLRLFRPADSGPFNSGQRAIQLAAHLGATRIILLGYDCTLANGIHWHGPHPGVMHNPTPTEVERWQADFACLVDQLRDVEIINASRNTRLTCFTRSTIEAVLNA